MNWSLMLNALLLIGVVIAIVRTVQSRRQQELHKTVKNMVASGATTNASDEIIAIRKVGQNTQSSPTLKPTIGLPLRQQSHMAPTLQQPKPDVQRQSPALSLTPSQPAAQVEKKNPSPAAETIMIFLLAKSNRQLAGYELLQAVLSAGFRFGDGGLFHRHQFPNCQGSVMCSLAAATPTGVFDLQNIGGFVVHGLCLFMQISGHREVDAERFDMMLDTARTLSDSLDTHLLDELREPLSENSIARYHQKLMLTEEPVGVE
ncbi:MAG: cell division protein ZipA [Legionellaceae bacterium]|nr:cell division protein ZipA [Legionellaceae bacterium]MBP9775230.1 cell division protein ZipA [Legionellaceae bacterium]